jgi:phosphohistidine phosphatase
MKTLFLMRHAKSSWKDPWLTDHQRPLNKRGKKAAPEMGRRLKKRGVRLDAVVSSDARRATDTAKAVADVLRMRPTTIRLEADLYHADADEIVEIVCRLNDSWEQVMVVGHNPGFTEVANRFYSDPIANLPTAGIVELVFDVAAWGHINRKNLASGFFDYPKRGR